MTIFNIALFFLNLYVLFNPCYFYFEDSLDVKCLKLKDKKAVPQCSRCINYLHEMDVKMATRSLIKIKKEKFITNKNPSCTLCYEKWEKLIKYTHIIYVEGDFLYTTPEVKIVRTPLENIKIKELKDKLCRNATKYDFFLIVNSPHHTKYYMCAGYIFSN